MGLQTNTEAKFIVCKAVNERHGNRNPQINYITLV